MSEGRENVLRFGEIAELLERILVKFNGASNLAFIVHVTPRLSCYDPAAVTVALLEVLYGDKPDWWDGPYPGFGEIYQRVRNIMERELHGCWAGRMAMSRYQQSRGPHLGR